MLRLRFIKIEGVQVARALERLVCTNPDRAFTGRKIATDHLKGDKAFTVRDLRCFDGAKNGGGRKNKCSPGQC
jgi:hypothetical protein